MTTYRLDLPRWDRDWQPTGRWRLNRRTGKPELVYRRPVWDALRGNARPGHVYGPRTRAVKQVIEAVAWLAVQAGIPRCERMTVQLHWAPGDRRRADEDNLVGGLFKACCDALARGRGDLPGLRLVEDDRLPWMEKRMPEIVPPPAAGLWLTVEVEPVMNRPVKDARPTA